MVIRSAPLWNGNAASNPDGWGFISWNEIAENTHIKPMQKWGNTSVNVLASLIASQASTPAAAGTLDDKNAAFAYSSSAWQDQTTTKPTVARTRKQPRVVPLSRFLSLDSRSASCIKTGKTYSKMEVYVDDVLVVRSNQKASTTTYQKRWDYPGQLARGQSYAQTGLQG